MGDDLETQLEQFILQGRKRGANPLDDEQIIEEASDTFSND